jgi:hypothetical protein
MWIALVARLVCGVGLFIGALALPAYASTITSAYNVGGSAVQGAFNFSTTADVFGGTLVFGSGSIFNGVNYSFNKAGSCASALRVNVDKDRLESGSCSFALNTTVSGDSLTYNISLNPITDQYTASGKISKTNGQFSWSYSGKGTDRPPPSKESKEKKNAVPEDWGLSDSLCLFAFALLAFGVLTRLGVLRTVHS